MKAKYKFPVSGEVKIEPTKILPIEERGHIYEFRIDTRNIITHIEVTIPVEDKWYPKLLATTSNHHQLIISNPALYFIQRNLRGIEALMSVWGLKHIDKNNFEIYWLPETPEEEEKLQIKNLSISSEKIMNIEDIPPLSFDLAARAVIKSWDGAKESTLSRFYSKGTTDMENQDFIDAIYDFYLIIESRFGDGKWRGNQIKQILKSSDDLKEAFKQVEIHPLIKTLNGKLLTKRASSEAYKNFDDFIEHIVNIRGELHHHSEKNRDAWNPNEPEHYELEAIYLQVICNHIIFETTWKYINEESAIHNYENQCSKFFHR